MIRKWTLEGLAGELRDGRTSSRKLVEQGPVDDILRRPQHPYTRRLLAAVPSLTPPARKRLDCGMRRDAGIARRASRGDMVASSVAPP